MKKNLQKLKKELRNSGRVFPAVPAFLLLSLCCVQAAVDQVPLVWDPSPSTNCTGYRIYYSQPGCGWTNAIAVGNATRATVNVAAGTNWFWATALNDNAQFSTNRESVFSNCYTNISGAPSVVALEVAPRPPSNLRGPQTKGTP